MNIPSIYKSRAERKLELAIFFNRKEEVLDLLRKGLDPNGYGAVDNRARHLHRAIVTCDIDILDALISKGANPLLPIEIGGFEFSLLESAKLARRGPDIVEWVERAEKEAVIKFGPAKELRKEPRACSHKRKM